MSLFPGRRPAVADTPDSGRSTANKPPADILDTATEPPPRPPPAALAEAVGSCTALIAPVLPPLAELQEGFELAPLPVVVDPWRLLRLASDDTH